VFAKVEAITRSWPKSAEVAIGAFMGLPELIANARTAAIDAEEQSARAVHGKIIQFQGHAARILGEPGIAVHPLRSFCAKCAELQA
jgi:hypothetical protein